MYNDPNTGNTVRGQLALSLFSYDPDTYNQNAFTEAQIMAKDKSWLVQPNRRFSKYFSMKRLSKEQNLKWQDCSEYAATTYNGLTKASLGILWRGNYLGQASQAIGYLKVSWYVTFKG